MDVDKKVEEALSKKVRLSNGEIRPAIIFIEERNVNPFYCIACDVYTSSGSVPAHANGYRHNEIVKKEGMTAEMYEERWSVACGVVTLEQRIKKALSQTIRLSNGDTRPAVVYINDGRKKPYHCIACDIFFPEANIVGHGFSKKHREASSPGNITLERYNRRKLHPTPPLSDKVEVTAADVMEKALSEKLRLSNGEIRPGMVYIKKNRSTPFYCIACDVYTSAASINGHTMGKKHQVVSSQGNISEETYNIRWPLSLQQQQQQQPPQPQLEPISTKAELEASEVPFECYTVPLIGLEYVAFTEDTPKKFLCCLCGSRGDEAEIVVHLISPKHRIAYLKLYFPKTFKSLSSIPNPASYQKGVSEVLSNIARAIENKFGRREPFVLNEAALMSQDPDTIEQVTRIAHNHRHFCETPECNFKLMVNLRYVENISASARKSSFECELDEVKRVSAARMPRIQQEAIVEEKPDSLVENKTLSALFRGDTPFINPNAPPTADIDMRKLPQPLDMFMEDEAPTIAGILTGKATTNTLMEVHSLKAAATEIKRQWSATFQPSVSDASATQENRSRDGRPLPTVSPFSLFRRRSAESTAVPSGSRFRSRSKSPVDRDRRSRSRSYSPVSRKSPRRGRSRTPSSSRGRKLSRGRRSNSRKQSPVRRGKSRSYSSRSRSRSPAGKRKNRSKSRSRSLNGRGRRSKSRSKSPAKSRNRKNRSTSVRRSRSMSKTKRSTRESSPLKRRRSSKSRSVSPAKSKPRKEVKRSKSRSVSPSKTKRKKPAKKVLKRSKSRSLSKSKRSSVKRSRSSKSRSPSPEKSKSKKEKSRSSSKTRQASKDKSKSKKRRSRSRSTSKARKSRSPEKSKSKKGKKQVRRSKSRSSSKTKITTKKSSPSKDRSKSRSISPVKSKSTKRKDLSRSRSPSKTRKSRSKSPAKSKSKKRKKAVVRTKSRSPSKSKAQPPTKGSSPRSSPSRPSSPPTSALDTLVDDLKPKPSAQVKELEDEKVLLLETYVGALKAEMLLKLKLYEKSPEKHPLYTQEWDTFWSRRYKEITAQGKDASKHDFKSDWDRFWAVRNKELNLQEGKEILKAFRVKIGLPAEADAKVEETITAEKELPRGVPEEEWDKFWSKRYREIVAEGKDASKHDFHSEWVEYWAERKKELKREDSKTKKKTNRDAKDKPVKKKEVSMKGSEEEWDAFWMRRYKEVTAEGKDPANHDFQSEWNEYWAKKNGDIDDKKKSTSSKKDRRRSRDSSSSEDERTKKTRDRKTLPDRQKQVISKILQGERRSFSTYKEIIAESKALKRERDRDGDTKTAVNPLPSESDKKKEVKSRRDSRSPVKSRRDSRSPDESRRDSRSPLKSRRHSRSPVKSRRDSKSPVKSRRDSRSPVKSRRDSRSPVKSRRDSRSPVKSRRDSRSPVKSRRDSRSPVKKEKEEIDEIPEGEWEKFWSKRYREVMAKGLDASKHDFQADWKKYWPVRKKELEDVQKVLATPVQIAPQPQMVPPVAKVPQESTDSFIFVLRLMVALEDQLGSMRPRVGSLLSQAIAFERIAPGGSDRLLNLKENVVFLESAKESLKDQLCSGTIERDKTIETVGVVAGLSRVLDLKKQKEAAAMKSAQHIPATVAAVSSPLLAQQNPALLSRANSEHQMPVTVTPAQSSQTFGRKIAAAVAPPHTLQTFGQQMPRDGLSAAHSPLVFGQQMPRGAVAPTQSSRVFVQQIRSTVAPAQSPQVFAQQISSAVARPRTESPRGFAQKMSSAVARTESPRGLSHQFPAQVAPVQGSPQQIPAQVDTVQLPRSFPQQIPATTVARARTDFTAAPKIATPTETRYKANEEVVSGRLPLKQAGVGTDFSIAAKRTHSPEVGATIDAKKTSYLPETSKEMPMTIKNPVPQIDPLAIANEIAATLVAEGRTDLTDEDLANLVASVSSQLPTQPAVDPTASLGGDLELLLGSIVALAQDAAQQQQAQILAKAKETAARNDVQLGTVDKLAIAQQIAATLVAQGRTDLTDEDLDQVINFVVDMARANSQAEESTSLQHSTTDAEITIDEANIQKLIDAVLEMADAQPQPEPARPPSPKPEDIHLDDLELLTLLKNFSTLSDTEKSYLKGYMKNLSQTDPMKVTRLEQMMKPKEASPEIENSEPSGRVSPLSARISHTNPVNEKPASGFEGDEYSFLEKDIFNQAKPSIKAENAAKNMAELMSAAKKVKKEKKMAEKLKKNKKSVVIDPNRLAEEIFKPQSPLVSSTSTVVAPADSFNLDASDSDTMPPTEVSTTSAPVDPSKVPATWPGYSYSYPDGAYDYGQPTYPAGSYTYPEDAYATEQPDYSYAYPYALPPSAKGVSSVISLTSETGETSDSTAVDVTQPPPGFHPDYY